jgi:hypothetical protein
VTAPVDSEEWRPVPGYPDYEVSDRGRVLSKKRNNPGGRHRLLRGVVHPRGYLQVFLRANGAYRNRKVHQLVLEAFVGQMPEGMEVRHLDGDKSNNTLPNLAYGTRSENVRDQLRHGTHNSAGRRHCLCGHPRTDHGRDRKDRSHCYGSTVCACTEYRAPGVDAAMKRHPAGKALPARFDERYDPSPEPIDRSIS